MGSVDDGDGVTPGEVVGGEAVLFRAEDERDARWRIFCGRFGWLGWLGGENGAQEGGSFRHGDDALLRPTAVERAGADDQRAVSDSLGKRVADAGAAQEIGRSDGGFCLGPVDGKGRDDGQVGKVEVGHGACGGTDVERVARRDEDDADAIGLVSG